MAIRNVDELLKQVKTWAAVPENTNRFDAAAILSECDLVIESDIVPLVLALNAQLLIKRQIIPITNATRYVEIPYRAVGQVVQNVIFTDGVQVKRLTPLDSADAYQYQSPGVPERVMFEGDAMWIYPRPANSGTLEVSFQAAHSKLVQTTACALVQSVNEIAKTLVVNAVPATFLAGETLVDVIKGRQGNGLRGMDLSIANINATTIEFTDALPEGVVPGDWVSLAEETPVLQLPREIYNLVALGATAKIIASQGDTELVGYWDKQFEDALAGAPTILAPRMMGETPKVTDRTGLVGAVRNFRRRL
jgi:hypothetical protein